MHLQLGQDLALGQVEPERFERDFQLVVVDVAVLVQVEQAEGLVDLFALLFGQVLEELRGGCFAAFALEALEALGF
jgi:hypothetical protein